MPRTPTSPSALTRLVFRHPSRPLLLATAMASRSRPWTARTSRLCRFSSGPTGSSPTGKDDPISPPPSRPAPADSRGALLCCSPAAFGLPVPSPPTGRVGTGGIYASYAMHPSHPINIRSYAASSIAPCSHSPTEPPKMPSESFGARRPWKLATVGCTRDGCPAGFRRWLVG